MLQLVYNIPIVLEHLFAIFSKCLCQFKCMSNMKSKKLKCWTLSMFTPSIVSVFTFAFLFGTKSCSAYVFYVCIVTVVKSNYLFYYLYNFFSVL